MPNSESVNPRRSSPREQNRRAWELPARQEDLEDPRAGIHRTQFPDVISQHIKDVEEFQPDRGHQFGIQSLVAGRKI